jgi:hypothetical protein
MVIGDLRLERVTPAPNETDAPPVVDPDAVLPSSVTLERLQPIPGRGPKVLEPPSPVKIQEPSSGDPLKGAKPRNIKIVEQRFGVFAAKRLNHWDMRVSRIT